MGQITNLKLPTESNVTEGGLEGAALLTNCYARSNGPEAKNSYSIYGSPGLDAWVTVAGAVNVRQMLATSDGLIAVVGRQIVRVKADGTSAVVGGLATDGAVFMGENRVGQVGIVSDGQYHVYQNGTVQQVQDPDLPPPIGLTEIGGYFVLPIADGRVYHTEVDDALSISALDFFTAESKPDGNVGNANMNNQLVTFGQRTAEFHGLAADADNPFSRATAINVGCWARGSIAEILQSADQASAGTTLMFAATDSKGAFAGVMMLNGYTPVKVSRRYQDRVIGQEADPDNIRSFSWTYRGHSFYCITGTNFSFVYDASEGKWHDRKTDGANSWQMVSHAHFAGTNVFGSKTSGVLYQESAETFAEGGMPLEMTIQFPPTTNWAGAVLFNAVHVDAATGVGVVTTNDQNADPVMLLDFSDDGGKHWSVPRELKLGQTAQTMKRLKARRLGRAKNARTFRLRCAASVFKAVHQAQMDVTVLRAA